MADLSSLSDDELRQLASRAQAPRPTGLQALSDDELRALAMKAAPKDDPVKAEVRKELEDMKAKGVPVYSDGKARQYLQGASFNTADEILAGLQTPIEMIKRGTFNPAKGYEYAKAREDLLMEDARKKGGLGGHAMEAVGGLLTGMGAAKAGATFMPANPATASGLRNAGGIIADSAAMGALSGAADANGADRLTEGLKGGAVGGVLGGALAGAAPVLSSAGRNLMGWASAMRNPEEYAGRQLARGVVESKKPVSNIAQELDDAAASNQPYVLADAMGNSGQRMLSTVTRAPGEGRTMAAEFLNNRQADQGGRIANAVDQALETGPTAKQVSADLMDQASKNASPLYAKSNEREFVWNPRMQDFLDDPAAKAALAKGVEIQRLEALARGEKINPVGMDKGVIDFGPAGENITGAVPNMRSLDAIKKGFDAIINENKNPMTGKLNEYGRAIDQVRKAFLGNVDKLNPEYAAARQAWAGPASVTNAVEEGQLAATRGRPADNIDTFNRFGNEAERQGFRTGYADKVVGRIESAPEGVNNVRRLTSPKSQAELAILSKYQGPTQPGQGDQLSRALGREKTMFETRNQALGGSKTADNLADADAMGVSPEIISNLLSGNVGTAAKNIFSRSSKTLNGYTPQVREALAKLLLQSNGQTLAPILQQYIAKDQARKLAAQQALRALIGGTSQGVESVKGAR